MFEDRLAFTWDPAKDAENRRKHGVQFAEAVSVFSDDRAQIIDDPDHSVQEERLIIMGISSRLRILMVCHCHREDYHEIRIISARKATRSEGIHYGRRKP
ncbi:MAG: BrnT family toxin [Planctomycetes bacterium]|nr:BrnT family toxin [Planctomycetota bacterium]